MEKDKRVALGKLPPLKVKPVPAFPGLAAAIGAGVVWAAIGQGSGELIWWPYLTAKYAGYFLFLVLPACFLGYWVNLEVIRYTALTGENIITGFSRLSRAFSGLLWIGMIATFLWFGGYASAGGTALAALTDFPQEWSQRGQSLFWAYLTILIYLLPLVLGRVVYRAIELIMRGIAIVSIVALVLAALRFEVLAQIPIFVRALFTIRLALPATWDAGDTSRLITAITFTGMGGYYTLMYSYWVRDKWVGMSRHSGRVTSPLTGEPEAIASTGFAFEDNADNKKHMKSWIRSLWLDNAVGVGINTFTLLVLCLLSLAILAPSGEVPAGWKIAVTQARFFEQAWGPFGRALFFIIAAVFLSDTWLGVTDAVSRMNADYLTSNHRWARRRSFRWWYYATVVFLTVVTCVTMSLDQPGSLILLGGVLNFLAMAVYCPALIVLNYSKLSRVVPTWARPGRAQLAMIILAAIVYGGLAIWYLVSLMR